MFETLKVFEIQARKKKKKVGQEFLFLFFTRLARIENDKAL